jgi:hypothetical protein
MMQYSAHHSLASYIQYRSSVTTFTTQYSTVHFFDTVLTQIDDSHIFNCCFEALKNRISGFVEKKILLKQKISYFHYLTYLEHH